MIFAGAGVSMGEPTNLPNFNKLTKEITRGTGEVFDQDKVNPERFLGLLESKNVLVQQLASEILNNQNLEPNKHHEYIVNLFKNGNIKIVTTNYDLMFEQICNNLDICYETYSIPAFPRGNDFSGIVHLHGDVKNPKNMVLTDSDFGKSYMVNGEASRFLSQLFNSEYVVLFVGYSYNDTVLRYFTRALPDLSGDKRFIFSTNKEKENHKFLGLSPILYNEGDYKTMYTCINKISDYISRDTNTWMDRIMEISNLKSDNIENEINEEILDIFNNNYILERFLNNINGSEWFYYFYENDLLDFVFEDGKLSQRDRLITNWIINNFISKDCEELISIFHRNNIKINNEFKNLLIFDITKKDIDDKALKKVLNLVSLDELYDLVYPRIINNLVDRKNFNHEIYTILDNILEWNGNPFLDKTLLNIDFA